MKSEKSIQTLSRPSLSLKGIRPYPPSDLPSQRMSSLFAAACDHCQWRLQRSVVCLWRSGVVKHLFGTPPNRRAHTDHSDVAILAGFIHGYGSCPQGTLSGTHGTPARSITISLWLSLTHHAGQLAHTNWDSNGRFVFHMPHITVNSFRATVCRAFAGVSPLRTSLSYRSAKGLSP